MSMKMAQFPATMKLYLLTTVVVLTLCSATCEEISTDKHGDLLEKLSELLKRNEQLTSSASKGPIRKRLTDTERAERVNRHFERMIQFVNVLGQIDNFISDRTKNIVRRLNAAYDLEENNRRPRKT